MKFLEIPAFEKLTTDFSGLRSSAGETVVYGKIEAYSCKRAGSDKKLYKSLEQQYQVELSKSPDAKDFSTSPFGPLTESSSRKTLISLISILNASFPDYDFCNLKPEQFRKENFLNMVTNSIDTTLANVIPKYNQELGPKIWKEMDLQINLKECDIYSFVPDYDSDPYAEFGNIWTFSYFFYNRKLKRSIFISFRASSHMSGIENLDQTIDDENEEEGWDYEEMDL